MRMSLRVSITEIGFEPGPIRYTVTAPMINAFWKFDDFESAARAAKIAVPTTATSRYLSKYSAGNRTTWTIHLSFNQMEMNRYE